MASPEFRQNGKCQLQETIPIPQHQKNCRPRIFMWRKHSTMFATQLGWLRMRYSRLHKTRHRISTLDTALYVNNGSRDLFFKGLAWPFDTHEWNPIQSSKDAWGSCNLQDMIVLSSCFLILSYSLSLQWHNHIWSWVTLKWFLILETRWGTKWLQICHHAFLNFTYLQVIPIVIQYIIIYFCRNHVM